VRKTGHIFSIFKSFKRKDKDETLTQLKYIRENTMTLLETLYKHLRYNGLTTNAEHFSTEYLNKSKSWYAVQTHQHRDFSASAAIQCLRQIRSTQANAATMSDAQRIALYTAEQLLTQHLQQQHAVAEIF